MEIALAIVGGIGLAAACGFRVFVPPFVTSLAAGGYLGEAAQGPFIEAANVQWLAEPTIAVALGVATAVEISSFYLPWIDNALDTIASPAAVVAGALLSVAVLPESADGGWAWLLSGIAGGSAAGAVQGTTVMARGASSLATGGLANPLLSTFEWVGAFLTAALAVLLPIVALVALVAFTVFALSWFRRRSRSAPELSAADG